MLLAPDPPELAVAPPVPAFYTNPASLDDLVTHTACRLLDLFDIDVGRLRRWGEDVSLEQRPRREGDGAAPGR